MMAENASIFVVTKDSSLSHLLPVSSIWRKIFCLESLDFEPSWGADSSDKNTLRLELLVFAFSLEFGTVDF